jgi:hypothetical protein
MRQRYDLTPEGARLLDKIMEMLAGADAADVANVGHSIMCWAISHLPPERQERIVAGLERSIPRALASFADAHAVDEAKACGHLH